MNAKLKQYVDSTNKIRKLAAPYAFEASSAEEYHQKLTEAFESIKECAEDNEKILAEFFYPFMDPNRDLSEEDLQLIRDFSALLITPESMESIDLPMFYLQSLKLLEDADRKEDLRLRLQALDNLTMAAYAMLMVTLRLYPSFNIFFRYRDAGYDAADEIIRYLEPSKFADLPDDKCKETVLINSRYISAFFEWADKTNFVARVDKDIAILEKSLSLCEDPFYLEQAPNYDWKYHEFRCLEYMANLHEYRKFEWFEHRQLKTVFRYTKKLKQFLEDNPDFYDLCPAEVCDFYLNRNGYLASEMTEEEYKTRLLELYAKRRMDDFTPEWVHFNFMIPYEYLSKTYMGHQSEQDKEFLSVFYSEMISYIYRLPRMGVMSFLLTCLSGILRNFVEDEDIITMEEMVPKLMAALHPPTYVHSLSVADFTEKLTEYLLDREPGIFVGALGTQSPQEVASRKADILDHVRRAAMLHDTGKLFISETIITYGRKLFMTEFDMIRAHPDTGADILEKHSSTAPYAYAARGHHLWYDGTDGYPEGFVPEKDFEKTIVDILTVADCLDAATDTFGRNYKKGKTLDEFIDELEEGRGTRYAPYVTDLFRDDTIREEMQSFISDARRRNYAKAYEMLKAF